MSSQETQPSSDRTLGTTRIFDWPRELVYAAITEPAAVAAWWGPAGFSNTFHEFDLRPGGAWRFVMHAPNGTEFENESVFLEVVAPERIVLRHLRPMHEFQLTISLTESGGRTLLTWTMVFESAAECERVRAFVTPANEQNLDRLQAQIRRMA